MPKNARIKWRRVKERPLVRAELHVVGRLCGEGACQDAGSNRGVLANDVVANKPTKVETRFTPDRHKMYRQCRPVQLRLPFDAEQVQTEICVLVTQQHWNVGCTHIAPLAPAVTDVIARLLMLSRSGMMAITGCAGSMTSTTAVSLLNAQPTCAAQQKNQQCFHAEDSLQQQGHLISNLRCMRCPCTFGLRTAEQPDYDD